MQAVAEVSSSYDTKIYTSLPQKLGFLELNIWISTIIQMFHPKTTVMLFIYTSCNYVNFNNFCLYEGKRVLGYRSR